MNPVLQELGDFLLSFAKQELVKYGEFFPFAASVNTRNEIEPVAIYSGDEHPESMILIDEFNQLFVAEARRKQLQAAGLCSDVRIALADGPISDAIRVELEHADGNSMTILTPYLLQNGAIGVGLPLIEARATTWFR